MEFANISALWWGLLTIPIVVLYILKIRLRRVPVSTVMFWDQIFEEKRPRSIWQQLRHLLSLLVQLAFLALLVFALLDPFWSWEKLQARRIVLVVDNSASMNAIDELPSRLAGARQQGQHLIRGLRPRDEMAIIAAGSAPRVVCGLTGHQRTLHDALESVPATDGPTNVRDGIALARRLLAGHGNPQVVVLTDGCFAEAAEFEDSDIELVLLGGKADNVGLTQFQVRRSLLDPIGYQVLVEVTNFSDEPVECRLEIDLNEQPMDVVPLKLAADERWSKVIEQTSADGGDLVARLQHNDTLPTDNRAVALLPRRERVPVILVTDGSLFLERVFEAIPIVDLQVTDQLPAQVPAGALVVYHAKAPETIPSGDVLVIDPAVSSDLWDLGEPLENPLVAEQQSDSPLMTHVRLDNVLMPEARKLEFTTESEVLAGSIGGEPIYSAVIRRGNDGRPEGRVLVLTVNLAKGDLPLRTAFPIMMTNAVSWFQGDKGELREAIAAGSLVEADLSPLRPEGLPSLVKPASLERGLLTGGASLVLRSPRGTIHALPGGVSKTTIGPLDECGVWTIEEPRGADQESLPDEAELIARRPKLEIACNLANAAESDLRPVATQSSPVRSDLLGIGGRAIWFYVCAAALVLIAVEWYLYQRRWIT